MEGTSSASSFNSNEPSTSNVVEPLPTPKEQYRLFKKRFKFLVYENECYQEELRNLQRKLLKLSRDKNFLLDRLLAHEKLSDSSDESDSSSAKLDEKPKPKRKPRNPQVRKKPQPAVAANSGGAGAVSSSGAVSTTMNNKSGGEMKLEPMDDSPSPAQSPFPMKCSTVNGTSEPMTVDSASGSLKNETNSMPNSDGVTSPLVTRMKAEQAVKTVGQG